MILNGCSSVSIGPCKSKTYSAPSPSIPRTFSKVAFPNIRSSWAPQQGLKYSSRGYPPLHLAALSSPLMMGEIGLLSGTSSIRTVPKRRRSFTTPKAFFLKWFKFRRYPAMQKKPMFFWRTLACLPYLMPVHETWMYAQTVYNLHPFFMDLQFITYPFLRTLGRLPGWFLMAYFISAYLGIVRRKSWPHFFRYHVVMGMLLEISLQVTGTTSRWMPRGLYWGKWGMHLWAFLAFGFLFTVLECIRCAICGMYADVPFLSNAAYIQIPFSQERTKDLS